MAKAAHTQSGPSVREVISREQPAASRISLRRRSAGSGSRANANSTVQVKSAPVISVALGFTTPEMNSAAGVAAAITPSVAARLARFSAAVRTAEASSRAQTSADISRIAYPPLS
ncbi:MAG TPA: hypothetical protein VFU74_14000 [Actinocrinis sp.]|nr:hypothetical protein [Actinocrinis sp.]